MTYMGGVFDEWRTILHENGCHGSATNSQRDGVDFRLVDPDYPELVRVAFVPHDGCVFMSKLTDRERLREHLHTLYAAARAAVSFDFDISTRKLPK